MGLGLKRRFKSTVKKVEKFPGQVGRGLGVHGVTPSMKRKRSGQGTTTCYDSRGKRIRC